jgi:hypothetical protein
MKIVKKSMDPLAGRMLSSRLLGYSATAGVALLAAEQARAEVVYTDLNPDITRTYNLPYALDLDGDGTDDVTFVIDQSRYSSYGYRSSYRRVQVNPAVSNSLLLSASSAPLGSNYLLSNLLPGWVPTGGIQAFFSTARSPGYPVDLTQGGPWLGAVNKFIGIRFQIDPLGANTTHYGWIRMSVGAQAQNFTISDYAYDNAPDTPVTTGVWLDLDTAGTFGAAFQVDSTDVDPLLAAFTSKPKVVGSYFDPILGNKAKKTTAGVVTKILKGAPQPNVRCEWKKAIRLYNAKAFKAAYAAGNTAEDFLATPIGTLNVTIQVQAKDGVQKYQADVWQYQIRPPTVSGVTNMSDAPVIQAGLGQYLKINGDWFGKKAPKAWLEYVVGGKVKMAKLKVLKPYEFADAAGKPGASCMDPDTGDSTLVVQMPTAWPSGWAHGPHNIVLDNGIGIASFDFATAP